MRRAAAGIRDARRAQHEEESPACRYYYYMGIIDILQTFDTRKAAESLAKQLRARLKGTTRPSFLPWMRRSTETGSSIS